VIAMSAGNHAQGVAYHAQRLGLRAVIVMPRFTPGVKVERTRGFGAEVVLHGDTLDEARTHAWRWPPSRAGVCAPVRRRGHRRRPGHGGAGDAGGRARPGCAGHCRGRRRADRGHCHGGAALKPGIDIVGVQTVRFPGMYNAIKHTQHPQGHSTIAEGIAVGTPGRITQEIIAQRVDDLVLVDEGDIEHAIVMLLEIEKTLVEGAGAAGLAALLKYPERFRGKKVGLVLCGGNIDPLLLSAIIERGMVRAGRLARVRVSARDVPGSLARITAIVSEAGANIDEVHHQRAFTTLSAQNVEIELVIQTRGREHIAACCGAAQCRV
jgi:threonine dehydratase